jgi:hypothetical protein
MLGAQGSFANPFPPFPTGPTAHVAPGFPAILAAIYRVFGTGAMGAFVSNLLEATMLVLQVALIPLAATALGADRKTGFLAALLAVAGMQRTTIWEANYVAFLLLVATLLACRYLVVLETAPRRTGLNFWQSPAGVASSLGVLWGMLLLIGPNAGSVWFVWILAGAYWSSRRGHRYAWLPAALLPLLFLIPWVVRNHLVFHKLIPVRGNFGLELAVANNPCAKASNRELIHSGCFEHPYFSRTEAQKMARIGEAEYNRMRMREAVTWIRGNFARALGLWTRRAAYFWFPSLSEGGSNLAGSTRRWSAWAVNLMSVLTFPGLVLLWRQSRPGAVICAIFLGIYPLIYYIVQFIDRYRFPIMWVTFILASVAIRACLDWLWRRCPAAQESSFAPPSPHSAKTHRIVTK